VESFFYEIKNSLLHDEDVKLSGFGNFEIIKKNARPGRNPKTGEAVTVSARNVVTFRAGQKLRSKVASQDG
jgi:integration host factor subunit alpha